MESLRRDHDDNPSGMVWIVVIWVEWDYSWNIPHGEKGTISFWHGKVLREISQHGLSSRLICCFFPVDNIFYNPFTPQSYHHSATIITFLLTIIIAHDTPSHQLSIPISSPAAISTIPTTPGLSLMLFNEFITIFKQFPLCGEVHKTWAADFGVPVCVGGQNLNYK